MLYTDSVTESADDHHFLLAGQEYTFGRKDCDILVKDDMSISRKHAVFTVQHPEANLCHPDRIPRLVMKDVSRFGSKIGSDLIKNGQERSLTHGDVFISGSALVSKFRVEYEPLLVTTSCLAPDGKTALKSELRTLGGHLVPEWKDACHCVVMSSLSVTMKVICALICQKPVVLPAYFEAWLSAVKAGSSPPSPSSFLPPLAESQISSDENLFNPQPLRRNIFNGKIFVFLTAKQFKRLSPVVEQGGGTPMLMESSGVGDLELMTSGSACVLHVDVRDATLKLTPEGVKWVKSVELHLQRCIEQSNIVKNPDITIMSQK
ncbi:hypothetical protein CAPTEDRAFT_226297 [Capitella teleta]|uniref:FHA domain-containing protein n=1 Tax=Capitella teleta TaxID=283909 RepID=R7TSH5_CAPTE|nr:hypothetical protein CAPTEDRAFT_226297 [Capitella teleta]|eukprot:ELT96609.1 hypothetical protein CAPTEDRAFT_226297 [Capitella teleta]